MVPLVQLLYNISDPCKSLISQVHSGELQELMKGPYNPLRPSAPALQRTARQLTSSQVDDVVADYRGRVGSIYVLASKYKVHRNTIAARLKERGIVLGKQPMDEYEIGRARELRNEGRSWNAIGAAIGRDPKTVKNAVM